MQLTLLNGYPDRVGRRLIFCGWGNGPLSYEDTGDPIQLPGYANHIDIIFPAVSVSGNYQVVGQPSVQGPRAAWVLIWKNAADGSAVSAGEDLSQETVQIGGFGGVY